MENIMHIWLLCLIFSFISFSKEKRYITSTIIHPPNNFSNIENNAYLNNTFLKNVFDLNENEKKNISICNLTHFVFILKNLTINSEINLNISSIGNNIHFENIRINDNEYYSKLKTSNINNIYFTPKNETVKVEITANPKDKEKKYNSFNVSFIKIEKNTKDNLRISAIVIGIFSGVANFGLATMFMESEKTGSISETFSYVFCCCCVKNKSKKKTKNKKQI